MKKFIKNPKFMISLTVVLIILILAILGPYIIPNDPIELNTKNILEGPSKQFPLGTDEYGRCLLSRIIMGIRPSLLVSFGGTFICLVFGSLLGMTAGFVGGKTKQIIMRLMDVILSFPPILLAMLVVGLFGGGVLNLIIIVGILYLPHFTRIAYSSTIQVVKQEFVESEISIGASYPRILLKVILPNILASLIIQISLTISNAILLESGLSFLGLGVIPPEPSLGQMIGAAKSYIAVHPTYVLWPSLFLSIIILFMNLLGDAVRDILDPKLSYEN